MRFGGQRREITHFIAMAFDLTDHGLVSRTTVLRTFGSVPDDFPIE